LALTREKKKNSRHICVITSHLVLGPLFQECPHPQAFFLLKKPVNPITYGAKQSKAELWFFFFKGVFVCSQSDNHP